MRHRPRRVPLVALVVALQLALCCVSATSAGSSTTAPSLPAIRAPLASAVTTPTGSWAVVAMGQLNQPLNTFWQLFYKAPTASLWHLVTPPGVADNGGLVVSVAGVGGVAVGFAPSQLLHYSPLARSSDDGATWAPALVPQSLVATPDSLSATTGNAGTALALVRDAAAPVLTSKGPLLDWHPLPGSRLLASGSDTACGATGLYAVSLTSSNIPLVGTGCRREGQVGIFAHLGSYWKLIGPSLRGSLRGTTTRILRLDSSGVTTTALLAEGGRGGIGLLGVWGSATGSWSESSRLALGGAPALRASAVGASGQQLVVVAERGKPAMLEEAVGPAQPWRRLPTPPTGAQTVSILADGSINAFSVDGSRLRIFTLAPNGVSWSPSQTMDVPIAYGSS